MGHVRTNAPCMHNYNSRAAMRAAWTIMLCTAVCGHCDCNCMLGSCWVGCRSSMRGSAGLHACTRCRQPMQATILSSAQPYKLYVVPAAGLVARACRLATLSVTQATDECACARPARVCLCFGVCVRVVFWSLCLRICMRKIGRECVYVCVCECMCVCVRAWARTCAHTCRVWILHVR
jgi:hypothetical protein